MQVGVIWAPQTDEEGNITKEWANDRSSWEDGATWERAWRFADGVLAECEQSVQAYQDAMKWYEESIYGAEEAGDVAFKGWPFKKVNGANDRDCVVRTDLPGWEKHKFFSIQGGEEDQSEDKEGRARGDEEAAKKKGAEGAACSRC